MVRPQRFRLLMHGIYSFMFPMRIVEPSCCALNLYNRHKSGRHSWWSEAIARSLPVARDTSVAFFASQSGFASNFMGAREVCCEYVIHS